MTDPCENCGEWYVDENDTQLCGYMERKGHMCPRAIEYSHWVDGDDEDEE